MIVAFVPRPREVFIQQQFYFSPNHLLGEVFTSYIEGEYQKKKAVQLYRSTRYGWYETFTSTFVFFYCFNRV